VKVRHLYSPFFCLAIASVDGHVGTRDARQVQQEVKATDFGPPHLIIGSSSTLQRVPVLSNSSAGRSKIATGAHESKILGSAVRRTRVPRDLKVQFQRQSVNIIPTVVYDQTIDRKSNTVSSIVRKRHSHASL